MTVDVALSPPARADLTGKRFGRYEVVAYAGKGTKQNVPMWRCRCDCGNERLVVSYNLVKGNSKSCGCLRVERSIAARRVHAPDPETLENRPDDGFTDLRGQSFNRWTVLSYAEKRPGQNHARWLCRCECGTERTVDHYHLVAGNSKSCGCFMVERSKEAHVTHGLSKTPEYRIYTGIITRCTNPKAMAWPDYGGRGIRMSDRWRHGDGGLSGFECFMADLGPRPSPAHSVERDDVNGHYEPGNCRWATKREQGQNRRDNVFISHKGRKLTITDALVVAGYTAGQWAPFRRVIPDAQTAFDLMISTTQPRAIIALND